MTLDAPTASIAAAQHPRKRMWGLLAAHFIGGRLEAEECEPISKQEFTIVMGLVVLATSAFGFIMHGWTR